MTVPSIRSNGYGAHTARIEAISELKGTLRNRFLFINSTKITLILRSRA